MVTHGECCGKTDFIVQGEKYWHCTKGCDTGASEVAKASGWVCSVAPESPE